MSIKKFAVDTRTINKAQFKAIKAAAKAAGVDVECWRWGGRETYPIMVRENSYGDSYMAIDYLGEYGPLVTYPEALHILSGCGVSAGDVDSRHNNLGGLMGGESEPVLTPKTLAQEAGFEVGDLGVVVEEDNFALGSIIRLVHDDKSSIALWELVEGKILIPYRPTDDERKVYERLSCIRKLNNVTTKT